MDIVDAQVHLNKIGIEEGFAAMDALGIRSVVIDEYEDGHSLPDVETYAPYVMVGDVPRPMAPVAEAASRRYPDRFAYLLPVLFDDPDLPALVCGAANGRFAGCRVGAGAMRRCCMQRNVSSSMATNSSTAPWRE